MTPIIMPQIGQDITKGTILRWLKKEGDPIAKHEVILTVESEKASFDVEAEVSGILIKTLHAEGEEVDVLSPVGYIGQLGESYAEQGSESPDAVDSGERGTAAIEPRVSLHAEEEGSAGGLVTPATLVSPATPVSPAARRLAREKGVDLGTVRGTGPGGRITAKDVEAATNLGRPASPSDSRADQGRLVGPPVAGDARPANSSVAPAARPLIDQAIPFEGARKVVARRVTDSSRTVPHFYLLQDVDMEPASAYREKENSRGNMHLTVTDLVIWATAKGLRDFPLLNSHVESDRLTVKAAINVGVAVSADRGLLVAVVPNADCMGLPALSTESRRLSDAARAGRLGRQPSASFTVSSLGMFGVSRFLPIINAPECGILAVGAVEPRVVPRHGRVEVRKTMSLTLACDHRAVDGDYAARFLNRIKETLENLGCGTEGTKSEQEAEP